MTERLDCSWELAQEAINLVRTIADEVVAQNANAAVVLGAQDVAFLKDWIGRFNALNAGSPPPPKERA